MFMGPTAFCYYFPAAVDYIVSPIARDDSDIVNCLCGLVEHRLKYDSQKVRDAIPAIMRFVEYVLSHYEDFALDVDVYGDLRPRLSAIKKHCAE